MRPNVLSSAAMAEGYFANDETRAERVRDLFDTIAPRYDLINDLQSFWLHRRWKKRLIKVVAGPCLLVAVMGHDGVVRVARVPRT